MPPVVADDPSPPIVWDADDGDAPPADGAAQHHPAAGAEGAGAAHPAPGAAAGGGRDEKKARSREETASISSSTVGGKHDELLYHRDVLDAIFHHIPIGVVLINAWGEVRGFSKGAERMFMYSSWEVVGENVMLLMPPAAASRHDYYLSRARQRLTQRLSQMLKQPEASIALDSIHFADEEQQQRVINDMIRMAMFGGQKREVLAIDKTSTAFQLEIAVSAVILKDSLYYLGYLVDVRDLTLFQDLTVKQELLLRSVLDSRILSRLLAGERVINDPFQCVTVGCIEIDDYFDKAIALDSDQQRADFVREVFHVVDSVVAESQVSKITSMGCNYMIACGVPVKREEHATLVVVTAVAIQQALAKFNKHALRGKKDKKDRAKKYNQSDSAAPTDEGWKTALPISLRIGIHTGSVVGSFFSQLKGEYNVYGTAAIRAGLLRDTCRPAHVHISAETHEMMSPELASLCTIRRDAGIPYTYDVRCTEDEQAAGAAQ